MVRTCMAAAALMLCVTAVWAQSDPIAERRALMKAQGAATGVGVKMIKGEEPFDAAKAREVYETYLKTTSKFATLFPDTAMTGGDSIASPKIWQDKAGFEAAIGKFDADIKLAMAKFGDADGFKAGMEEVGKNCQSCHTDFRLKRN